MNQLASGQEKRLGERKVEQEVEDVRPPVSTRNPGTVSERVYRGNENQPAELDRYANQANQYKDDSGFQVELGQNKGSSSYAHQPGFDSVEQYDLDPGVSEQFRPQEHAPHTNAWPQDTMPRSSVFPPDSNADRWQRAHLATASSVYDRETDLRRGPPEVFERLHEQPYFRREERFSQRELPQHFYSDRYLELH